MAPLPFVICYYLNFMFTFLLSVLDILFAMFPTMVSTFLPLSFPYLLLFSYYYFNSSRTALSNILNRLPVSSMCLNHRHLQLIPGMGSTWYCRWCGGRE